MALIPRFSISHVRRDKNQEADKLANRAMDTRRNSIQWE
jgi:ribonuclease HI